MRAKKCWPAPDWAILLGICLPTTTVAISYYLYISSEHRRSFVPFISELGCNEPNRQVFSMGIFLSAPWYAVIAWRMRAVGVRANLQSAHANPKIHNRGLLAALFFGVCVTAGLVVFAAYPCPFERWEGWEGWEDHDSHLTRHVTSAPGAIHIFAIVGVANAGAMWLLVVSGASWWRLLQLRQVASPHQAAFHSPAAQGVALTRGEPMAEAAKETVGDGDCHGMQEFGGDGLELPCSTPRLLFMLGLQDKTWALVLQSRLVFLGLGGIAIQAMILCVATAFMAHPDQGLVEQMRQGEHSSLPLLLAASAEWATFMIPVCVLFTFHYEMQTHDDVREV